MMRLLLAVLLLCATAADAAAGCLDPRGCWPALCAYPGNVVELTMLGPPTSDEVWPGGLWRVRIESVTIVDADQFMVPSVGAELDIAPLAYRSSPVAPDVGARFVAVTQGPDNIAWSTFALDDEGVSCATGPRNHLTIGEMVAVIESGDCNGGAPLPRPLRECNDQGEGCAGAGTDLAAALVALTLLRSARRARSLRR